MLDSRPSGHGLEPHQHHCFVSLSKNINPSLVLVQPRKTRPEVTERLLMGGKESNQTITIIRTLLEPSHVFKNVLAVYKKLVEHDTLEYKNRAVLDVLEQFQNCSNF